MEIKIATHQDVDTLLQLRFENAQYHAKSVVHQALKADALDFLKQHTINSLNKTDGRILIAKDQNEMVGYIIGFINKSHPIFEAGAEALIDDFYVRPSHRKKGYGKELYKLLLDWFEASNMKRVNLNVYANNPMGVNFWERMNFKTVFYKKSKGLN